MSKEKEIAVIIVEPRKPARVEVIPNTLEKLQALVGGYVEPIREDGFDILVNEDGKNLDLEPNFSLYGGFDYVAGTAVFIGVDYKVGEWKGLSEYQMGRILSTFSKREGSHVGKSDKS